MLLSTSFYATLCTYFLLRSIENFELLECVLIKENSHYSMETIVFSKFFIRLYTAVRTNFKYRKAYSPNCLYSYHNWPGHVLFRCVEEQSSTLYYVLVWLGIINGNTLHSTIHQHRLGLELNEYHYLHPGMCCYRYSLFN